MLGTLCMHLFIILVTSTLAQFTENISSIFHQRSFCIPPADIYLVLQYTVMHHQIELSRPKNNYNCILNSDYCRANVRYLEQDPSQIYNSVQLHRYMKLFSSQTYIRVQLHSSHKIYNIAQLPKNAILFSLADIQKCSISHLYNSVHLCRYSKVCNFTHIE